MVDRIVSFIDAPSKLLCTYPQIAVVAAATQLRLLPVSDPALLAPQTPVTPITPKAPNPPDRSEKTSAGQCWICQLGRFLFSGRGGVLVDDPVNVCRVA